eukprot:10092767-Lingulodinium_polyedra.AAC.1
MQRRPCKNTLSAPSARCPGTSGKTHTASGVAAANAQYCTGIAGHNASGTASSWRPSTTWITAHGATSWPKSCTITEIALGGALLLFVLGNRNRRGVQTMEMTGRTL